MESHARLYYDLIKKTGLHSAIYYAYLLSRTEIKKKQNIEFARELISRDLHINKDTQLKYEKALLENDEYIKKIKGGHKKPNRYYVKKIDGKYLRIEISLFKEFDFETTTYISYLKYLTEIKGNTRHIINIRLEGIKKLLGISSYIQLKILNKLESDKTINKIGKLQYIFNYQDVINRLNSKTVLQVGNNDTNNGQSSLPSSGNADDKDQNCRCIPPNSQTVNAKNTDALYNIVYKFYNNKYIHSFELNFLNSKSIQINVDNNTTIEYNNKKFNLLKLLTQLFDTNDESINTSTSFSNISASSAAKIFVSNYSKALNIKASDADFENAKLTDEQYSGLGYFINPYFLKILWQEYNRNLKNKTKVDNPRYSAFVKFNIESDLLKYYDHYCEKIIFIFENKFVDYLYQYNHLILKAVPEFLNFANYYNYRDYNDNERHMYLYGILNKMINYMNNDEKKELAELLDLFRHKYKFFNKPIKALNEIVDFSKFENIRKEVNKNETNVVHHLSNFTNDDDLTEEQFKEIEEELRIELSKD
jgi:hypothetical protein